MITTKGEKSVTYLKNCLVMDYVLHSKNNHTELYNLQQALTSSEGAGRIRKCVWCQDDIN